MVNHVHQLHQTTELVQNLRNVAAPPIIADQVGDPLPKSHTGDEILSEEQVLALLEEHEQPGRHTKRFDLLECPGLRSEHVPRVLAAFVRGYVSTCFFDHDVGVALCVDCPIDAALVQLPDHLMGQKTVSDQHALVLVVLRGGAVPARLGERAPGPDRR